MANEKQVNLTIADISGYTNFMLANDTALEHSQAIISDILTSLIQHMEKRFELSKLEGDAVFMYSDLSQNQDGADEADQGQLLLQAFDVFTEKMLALIDGSKCPCGACRNLDKLRLKVIFHTGKAVFYEIKDFKELAGKDVILIHRLLKNSIQSNQYIMLTESGKDKVAFNEDIQFVEGTEKYDEFGEVPTFTYLRPMSEKHLKRIQEIQVNN